MLVSSGFGFWIVDCVGLLNSEDSCRGVGNKPDLPEMVFEEDDGIDLLKTGCSEESCPVLSDGFCLVVPDFFGTIDSFLFPSAGSSG